MLLGAIATMKGDSGGLEEFCGSGRWVYMGERTVRMKGGRHIYKDAPTLEAEQKCNNTSKVHTKNPELYSIISKWHVDKH
jgi:hypothetical protein